MNRSEATFHVDVAKLRADLQEELRREIATAKEDIRAEVKSEVALEVERTKTPI